LPLAVAGIHFFARFKQIRSDFLKCTKKRIKKSTPQVGWWLCHYVQKACAFFTLAMLKS